MKTIYLLFSVLVMSGLKAENIKRIDIKAADVSFVARVLNEISDTTIASTPKAGKTETPALLMKNKNIHQAISILCKATDLAYSYDKELDTYTLKTLEEYRDSLNYYDLVITEHFKVKPLNLDIIGSALEDLFGARLFLSYGLEVDDEILGLSGFGSTSGSSFGSNSSNRNNNNRNNNNRNNNNRNNNNNEESSRGNLSRNTGSGGNRNNSSQTGQSKKRFELDFTTEIAFDIEKIRRETEPEKLQSALSFYLRKIRKDLLPIIVTLNQEHSQITVRTIDPSGLLEITRLVEELDKDVPQILLEMKILELTLGDGFTSSFDYQLTDTPFNNDSLNLGDVTKNLGTTLTYDTLHSNLQARIQVLRNNNQLEVLATPILMSANNREAVFAVVDEDLLLEGFDTATRNVALGDNVTGTEVFAIPRFVTTDIGLTLGIRPKIIDKDKLTLTIAQASSDKKVGATTVQFLVGDDLEDRTIDIKTERAITQTVKAVDGRTIAVGGLVDTRNETTEEKVPILGDIPLLGYFFKEEVTSNVKTELILLITPHIIYSEEDLKKSKELMKKLSDHKFHEGGQKIIDEKNSTIKEYKNPTKNPIRDFVKDPVETIKKKE